MKSLLFTVKFGSLLKNFTKNVHIKQLKYSVNFNDKNNFPKLETMKVLNVAEKNDAAKNIAGLLGRGNCQRREGFSKYNKIYEFQMRLWNQNCTMTMTSVSGHLLGFDFVGAYRKWQGCHPLALFDAPVIKHCSEDFMKIKRTLEREIRQCAALIIWTDCDREGENIGFEIIEVCKAVKPNIKVYRAKFSEITQASVHRAIQTLGEPNKAVSDAVNVRSELDLRIGAAFTRFQTLRLQKVFPRNLAEMLISYGSCQFPTLGFVVERFLAIERFKPEPYWKIKVCDDRDNINVEFRWARFRLFEKLPCQVYYDILEENPDATVEKVMNRPKSKWRPLPLDTIELEKQGSRKLRINAKETMKIAERLYTQGLISYPRTETNIFPKELNLMPLVEQQLPNNNWGEFAQRVLDEGISPRHGKKSDQAHPPIHPTKYTDTLQGNEARVYEFVVRHFLACLSKNAEAHETTVEIDIADEKFTTNGLQIIAKNYLDVYIYEKWNAKEIHFYEEGQVFRPTSIDMIEERTSPPNLLTEADLISLMDKHGIGTDATHAEHIETIKSRQYVGLRNNTHFIPGKLGIGLVMGYDNMGFQMSKPNLRAELENDLKLICQGQKNPDDVLQAQINNYREVFRVALERANLIDDALAEYLDERPVGGGNLEMITPAEDAPIFKCPRCGQNMVLRERRDGGKKYIGCMGYPTCKNSIWFQDAITNIEILPEVCNHCPGGIKKLKFKIKPGAIPLFGNVYETCIGGCDNMFNEAMRIRDDSVMRVNRTQDSGYSSSNTSVSSTQNLSQSQRGGHNSTLSNRGGRGGTTAVGVVRPQNPPPPLPPGNPRPPLTRPPLINLPGNRDNQNRNKRTSDEWDVVGTGNTIDPKRPKIGNIGFGNTGSASNSNNNDGDVFLCDCNQRAVKLTVRKEGPNTGRLFYKCAQPQGSGCKFFLWDSDEAPAAAPPPRGNQSQNQRTQFSNNSFGNASNSNNYGNDDSANDNWDVQPAGWNQNNRTGPSNFGGGRGGYGRGGAGYRGRGGGGGSDGDAPECTCGEPARKLTVRKEGPNKGKSFYGCPQGPGSTCKFFAWADEVEAGGSGGFDDFGSRGRGRGGGGKRKCGNCGTEGHNRRNCPDNAMDT